MTKRTIRSKKRIAHPRTQPPQQNLADDQGTPEEVALMAAWLDRQRHWEASAAAAPYDGVLGSLPPWVPRGINSEFVRIRNNLLGDSIGGEKITRETALTWIERYTKIGETDEDTYIPREFFDVIGLLARWRYVVSLGREKGLRELGVPSAAFLGRKQGAMEPETLFLAQLRKKYPHEPADDLYRTLRAIAQTPSSPRNPTPEACPFKADHIRGQLEILKRGKRYPLGTFRNAITRVDKLFASGELSDI